MTTADWEWVVCPEWASEMRDRTRCEFVNVPEPHRPVNGATFGEPNGRDLSRGPPLIHSQAGSFCQESPNSYNQEDYEYPRISQNIPPARYGFMG